MIKKIPEMLDVATLNFQTLLPLIIDNPYEISLYNKIKPLFYANAQRLSQTYKQDHEGKIQPFIALDTKEDIMLVYLSLIKAEELKQLNDSNVKIYTYKSAFYKYIFIFGLLSALFFLLAFIDLNRYFKRY